MIERFVSQGRTWRYTHPRENEILAGALIAMVYTSLVSIPHFSAGMKPMLAVGIWISLRCCGRMAAATTLAIGTLGEVWLDIVAFDRVFSDAFLWEWLLRAGSYGLLLFLIVPQKKKVQRRPSSDRSENPIAHPFREAMHGRGTVAVVVDCDRIQKVIGHDPSRPGEEVLRILSRTLKANTRHSDLVARVGDDEFVVILPEIDEDEVRRMMTKVERSFSSAIADAGYAATVSIGIASTPDEHCSLDALISKAEGALIQGRAPRRSEMYLN